MSHSDLQPSTRLAIPADMDLVGRFLHDFSLEYNEPTPSAAYLSARLQQLLSDNFVIVLVNPHQQPPAGFALLRFRPAYWSDHQECYLAEYYVQPHQRGHGLGTMLLDAVVTQAKSQNADYLSVSTSDNDATARHLYAKFGFSRHEGRPDGPIMYCYERDL